MNKPPLWIAYHVPSTASGSAHWQDHVGQGPAPMYLIFWGGRGKSLGWCGRVIHALQKIKQCNKLRSGKGSLNQVVSKGLGGELKCEPRSEGQVTRYLQSRHLGTENSRKRKQRFKCPEVGMSLVPEQKGRHFHGLFWGQNLTISLPCR